MYISCVVCGNCIKNTEHTRPEVLYHQFPSNDYLRRKWLKVCGIDHSYKWQRVCSDHFLKQHYRNKGLLFRTAIPQLYDRSGNGNGFLHNFNTQSNGMQVDDNTFLPIEQNRLREEPYVENDVVNNLLPPKPSSKQIERQIPADQFIANDNIQTVIKSVVEPVTTTTKDFEPDWPMPGGKTNTDEYIKDNGFIFEISKWLKFNSLFWKSDHVKERNETIFYQRGHNETSIAKKVCFYNSLVPIIIIYDKNYKFNEPIRSKNSFIILLNIISCIEKCSGTDEKCIELFEECYLELQNLMEKRNEMPTQREIISYISNPFPYTS